MLSLIGVLLDAILLQIHVVFDRGVAYFIKVSKLGESLAAVAWGNGIPVVPDPQFQAGKLYANGEHRARMETQNPADASNK
jgi:hypothetical protein